jgi:hypothetical protein
MKVIIINSDTISLIQHDFYRDKKTWRKKIVEFFIKLKYTFFGVGNERHN